MTLELTDFLAETKNAELEDFPPEAQERINAALEDLSSAAPAPPEDASESIVVDPDGDGDYTSIQTAIDEEGSNVDVIFIESGTYEESVTVDVPDLTLRGISSDRTTIDASGKERGLDIKADGVTVRDLTVDSAGAGVNGETEVEGIFVGDPDGFTDNGGTISIENVDVTNVDGSETVRTAEGIHVKHYDGGDPIEDVTIENVTIDSVDGPPGPYKEGGRGANGIKLQSNINNIDIIDTEMTNIVGGWGYGVTLTASTNESGIPGDVNFDDVTIDNVDASDYDSTGVGIGSASGNATSPESGKVADPNELSFEDTNTIASVDTGLLNKNTSVTLSIPDNVEFQSVETKVKNADS